MEIAKPYKIEPSRSSVRKNMLTAFFLILVLNGIIIHTILTYVIHIILTRTGLDRSIVGDISRQITLAGSGVTLAALCVSLLSAFLLVEKITGPIKRLTDGMIDMAKGSWNTKINVTTDNELGQLAQGFNFMGDQIRSFMHELKASKEFTDNIVVSVPSILIVLSNRFQVLSTNMAYEKLREQFPALSVNQFVNSLEGEIISNLDSGETKNKEINLVPEGSEVSLIFSAVVSRIGEGGAQSEEETASILLTITDITERRRMKELVMQSRQDWEDTFNTIPDMITVHDKDYNIVYANKAAGEIMDLPVLDPARGEKCYKYYHGTETAPQECPSCDCLNTGMPATFEVFEPHLNKFIEIRSIPRINKDDDLIGLIHIVRDISVRKQIEDEHNQLVLAITKAKMEWEMTFDSVREFVLLIDRDLRIVRCNKSFAEYVRQPVDAIMGHSCHEFFSCADPQVDECMKCMGNSRDLPAKSELETEAGRWLYISHRPIKDDNDNLLKSVIIATDVTEIKTAEKKIKESEKELKKKVDDLEKFYDMAVGREVKMKGLKKEVKRLNKLLEDYEERQLVK